MAVVSINNLDIIAGARGDVEVGLWQSDPKTNIGSIAFKHMGLSKGIKIRHGRELGKIDGDNVTYDVGAFFTKSLGEIDLNLQEADLIKAAIAMGYAFSTVANPATATRVLPLGEATTMTYLCLRITVADQSFKSGTDGSTTPGSYVYTKRVYRLWRCLATGTPEHEISKASVLQTQMKFAAFYDATVAAGYELGDITDSTT